MHIIQTIDLCPTYVLIRKCKSSVFEVNLYTKFTKIMSAQPRISAHYEIKGFLYGSTCRKHPNQCQWEGINVH